MRSDMGKVLVERPRVKSFGYSRKGKGYKKALARSLKAGESTPVREGMQKPYGHGTKEFNEHLGPLRRFLDSNVGRPWDKVYSEICQHVDRGNVVQKHILTHLFEYVVRDVIVIAGKACNGTPGFRYGEPLGTSRYAQWYVCPKSGLLRRCKRVSRREYWALVSIPHVRVSARQLALKWKGQWEMITLGPLKNFDSRVDVLLHEKVYAGYHKLKHVLGPGVYAIARRPMTKAERRALPLPIDVVE